jgi:hypothetical protein
MLTEYLPEVAAQVVAISRGARHRGRRRHPSMPIGPNCHRLRDWRPFRDWRQSRTEQNTLGTETSATRASLGIPMPSSYPWGYESRGVVVTSHKASTSTTQNRIFMDTSPRKRSGKTGLPVVCAISQAG